MSTSSTTLPQAFQLVRQLLAEKPRAFQEILATAAASTSATTSTTPTTGTGKGKGKGRLVAGESHVPEGHPFVSASYLKTRVLPILSSQGLITKSKSSKTHQYSLTPTELIPEHWSRLLSGESPSQLGYEYTTTKTALALERKELRAPEERLMWYRSGKEMGRLAVPLDRGYLNRRKSKKRYGNLKEREAKLNDLVRGAEPWASA